jgi:hypothetical protein
MVSLRKLELIERHFGRGRDPFREPHVDRRIVHGPRGCKAGSAPFEASPREKSLLPSTGSREM